MTTRRERGVSRALKYIEEKLRELLPPGFEVRHRYLFERAVYRFNIAQESNHATALDLQFSEEVIEDFEAVLQREDFSSYGARFRGYVDFKIYIEMGKTNLLPPEFRISKKFLEEDRKDWWRDKYVRVTFDSKTTTILYNGLRKIEKLLSA